MLGGSTLRSDHADDTTLANFLADKIRQAKPGLNIFIASRAGNIPTGQDWLLKIREELRNAEGYLVLLTPTSIQREWIWFESGAAWMSGRWLIPMTADGLSKGQVPLPLGAHQALSLEDPTDVAQLGVDIGAPTDSPEQFCAIVRAICSSRTKRPDGATHGRSADTKDSQALIQARASMSPDRIILWNEGEAPGKDIDIIFEGDVDPIPANERGRKLPLRTLAPGREYPLVSAFSMGRVPPFPARVSWTDPDGTERNLSIIVHE